MSPVGRSASLHPGTSLYLDLARFLAAVLVLLDHVFAPPLYASNPALAGSGAVDIFFVISGFVIAYASAGMTDWRDYAAARLARIYSVALPALVLTGALYGAAMVLWAPGAQATFDHPMLRLVASMFFVNQIWNLTIAALTNGPYWSLCYEVWYYLLFGLAMFTRGWGRILAVALVVLAVGPRILLMLPLWLAGCGLYHLMKRPVPLALGFQRLLFAGFALATIAALSGINPLAPWADALAAQLERGGLVVAGTFIFIGAEAKLPRDAWVAAMFAGTVYFSGASFSAAFVQGAMARTIRTCASYTFSLYLFHAPLLVFLLPALTSAELGAAAPWLALSIIVACVALLGRYTEHRKGPYLTLARRLLGRSGAAVVARPAPSMQGTGGMP